jgi:hypothetical protein
MKQFTPDPRSDRAREGRSGPPWSGLRSTTDAPQRACCRRRSRPILRPGAAAARVPRLLTGCASSRSATGIEARGHGRTRTGPLPRSRGISAGRFCAGAAAARVPRPLTGCASSRSATGIEAARPQAPEDRASAGVARYQRRALLRRCGGGGPSSPPTDRVRIVAVSHGHRSARPRAHEDGAPAGAPRFSDRLDQWPRGWPISPAPRSVPLPPRSERERTGRPPARGAAACLSFAARRRIPTLTRQG